MESIGKAQVIAKAWEDSILGVIPRDERDYPDWYRRRLQKCAACEYNNRNIPFWKVPLRAMGQRLIGRDACSICGCFIKEKAWMRSESCPLSGDGQEPRWKAMEVITLNEYDFDVEISNENYNIGLSDDGKSYRIDLYNVRMGDKVPVDFALLSNRPFHIIKINRGCGCVGQLEYDKDPLPGNRNNVFLLLDTSGKAPNQEFNVHLGIAGYYGDDEARNRAYVDFEIRGFARRDTDPKP